MTRTGLRRVAVTVLALVVVVIGGWNLGRDAVRGPRRTSELLRARTRAAATGAFSYFDCLERELRLRLPAHAVVFPLATDDSTYQRLAEVATPWARVAASRAGARLTISFVPAPPGTGCGGTQVAVRSA